jgi:hypothetical protein
VALFEYVPDAKIWYCPSSGHQNDEESLAQVYILLRADTIPFAAELPTSYPVFAGAQYITTWLQPYQSYEIDNVGMIESSTRQVLVADTMRIDGKGAQQPTSDYVLKYLRGNHGDESGGTRSTRGVDQYQMPVSGGNVGHFDTHVEWRNIVDMVPGAYTPAWEDTWWYW